MTVLVVDNASGQQGVAQWLLETHTVDDGQWKAEGLTHERLDRPS
jgi:hypothetical protein